jgi:peptidoglycan hydrolase-like protein with peptidoglycan-binding domain
MSTRKGCGVDNDADRMFTESLHPRVPAGKHGGGEFGKAGNKKAPAPKSTGSPVKAMPKKAPSPPKGTLAYDPKTGRGPGYGVKGGDPQVKKLQAALNALGLRDIHGHKLQDDGMLGPLTTQSIKAAQRRLGLKADGQVTPELMKQLLAAKSLPAKRNVEADDGGRAAGDEMQPDTYGAAQAAQPAGVALSDPIPTQTAMVDEDCEAELMRILADLPDDEIAYLGELAEQAQMDGGY